MKTAIVIRATGLIGSHLTNKLLEDSRYAKVKTFSRRSIDFVHPKLEEEIVDFEKLSEWKSKISGDELFSALGTTIKKAGSKEAQFKIDFTYQYLVAKAAFDNGVGSYLLVSSIGANTKSRNFYLKIKGALEENISRLHFKHIFIFQPSLLTGVRIEKRFGENFSAPILKIISVLPFFKKYKPIQADIVAEGMIKAANQLTSNRLVKYSSNKIFDLVN